MGIMHKPRKKGKHETGDIKALITSIDDLRPDLSAGPAEVLMPIPRRKGRVIMTAEVKERFLRHYVQHGAKTHAAIHAGVCSNTVYNNMERDPDFKHLVEEAQRIYQDSLVREAHRRAVEGNEEALYFQGKLTGHVVKRKSDRLLERLLEARAPGFGRKVDVEHKHTGGVLVVHTDVNNRAEWEAKFGGDKSIGADEQGVIEGEAVVQGEKEDADT